jgi:hypothetical protein
MSYNIEAFLFACKYFVGEIVLKKIYDSFSNPTNEYRGKPFWSWNGKLEKEELLRQIYVIKEMGFGGFFMHSRTGLQTEYLGDEWFDCINACADEGEKLGLEAWLYDEDRWPSGTAGGMVTEEPEYRMKFLQMDIISGDKFIWSKDIVAAFGCKLKELVLEEYEVITETSNLERYKNFSIIKFTVVEMEKSSFYNGYTYVDALNKEATSRFIELTHEKYKQYCGNRLGKTIKGIFTDEPHRGAVMNSFGASNEGLERSVPWTYTLFNTFEKRFGYNVKEKLPELFLWYKGERVSQVKWHYIEILQEMFIENFAKPINEWCKEHNLILTGHVLQEDSLAAQTAMSGSMMRFYEHMGYPGVDVLTEWNKNYWIVKQLSSAARQLGQKFLLSELYGCTGWQFNFESHRNVGLWQAMFGINLRCPHLSWYTMEGEAKRDYPASIFYQSAWYKDYKHVEDYFSRIGFIMSQGNPVCDTLVINPVESIWSQVHPGWCRNLGPNTPDILKVDENYAKLFNWLQGAHIDFDYGDEEMLSRLSSIETRDNCSVLKVGHAEYKQIMVAGMTTIRLSTIRLLLQFINAGGKVIFAGEVPLYVDAVPSMIAQNLSVHCERVEFDRDAIVNTCRKLSNNLVEIRDSEGRELEDIFIQVRQQEENYYVLMINTSMDKAINNVNIKFSYEGYVEEWDCSTGERFKGDYEMIVDFQQGGEHLFVITPEKNNTLRKKPDYQIKESSEIKGNFEYKLDEPNVCVLDMAAFSIDNSDWHKEDEILKVDRKVRKHFKLPLRSGEMIQPWYGIKKTFSIKGKLKTAFEFYVEEIPERGIELVMERPELYRININGKTISADITADWWIDKSFKRIPLSLNLIAKGKNRVELEADYHEGINLEAIYIIGEFAVSLDESRKTIVKLPDKLKIGDITAQGFPFYSGRINYYIDIDKECEKDERIFISFDSLNAACIKVNPEKNGKRIIGWKPYEVDITEEIKETTRLNVEVILTRRNTFGPLHQIPLQAFAYGPDNFVTEGENYSSKYLLVPSGLTGSLKLLLKKLKG